MGPGAGNVPPKVRAYNSANISIATATWTALTFDSERFDTDTMHSTVSNTGRITFTTAGLYIVGFNFEFALATNGGDRGTRVQINGGTNPIYKLYIPLPVATTTTTLAGEFLWQFAANDYITFEAYQGSGGNLNVTNNANYSPEVWAIFQST